jgi:hypothetical protein
VSDGLLHHPLDFVRRRLTKGLQLSAGSQEKVRRGEQVEALVTITRPHGLGDLAVGLVCTEYYDFEQTWTDKDGSHTSRETAEATAHETWQPVESATGVQSVRLTIPPEAPFSYKGDCLSFKWEVVAKGRKRHRLDAQARREIVVFP